MANHPERKKTAALTVAGRRLLTNASAAGSYDGAELKPYEGRIGATDALAVPSLIGTQRYFRPSISGCK